MTLIIIIIIIIIIIMGRVYPQVRLGGFGSRFFRI